MSLSQALREANLYARQSMIKQTVQDVSDELILDNIKSRHSEFSDITLSQYQNWKRTGSFTKLEGLSKLVDTKSDELTPKQLKKLNNRRIWKSKATKQ